LIENLPNQTSHLRRPTAQTPRGNWQVSRARAVGRHLFFEGDRSPEFGTLQRWKTVNATQPMSSLEIVCSLESSGLAVEVFDSLAGGYMPLLVGNTIFIPRRAGSSIKDIAEATGIDECLIFVSDLNDNYFVIDCPC
jgi:hypothetical protein